MPPPGRARPGYAISLNKRRGGESSYEKVASTGPNRVRGNALALPGEARSA